MRHIEYKTESNYFNFASKKYWDELISWTNVNVVKGFNLNVQLVTQANNFMKDNNAKFLTVLIPTKEMVYGNITEYNFYKE